MSETDHHPTAPLLSARTRRRAGRVAGVVAVPLAAALLVALTLHSRAAAPAATTPTTGTVPTTSAPRPTIVLVHGAFADASTYTEIVKRLQHDGYPVQAPANPLRGIPADTAYLRGVLDSITGPIVLVGHSYAGAVISNLASGDSRIRALVYVAAFLPEVGEPLGKANAGSKDVLLGPDAQDVRTYPTGGGATGKEAYVKADRFHQIMAADVSTALATALAASQRPIDVTAFADLPTSAAWKTIPSWCLIPDGDRAIGADAERAMAARAKCHTVEIGGSHLVMLVKPEAVTRVIEDAANATAH